MAMPNLSILRPVVILSCPPEFDVRIDAERDRRPHAASDGDLRQHLELGLGLDVELADPGGERLRHLVARLADAGEHDALGRDVGGQRDGQFAARNHVGAGAELGERAHDGEARVRLERIAHGGIEPGEGGSEPPIRVLDGRGRIDVAGRADEFGDLGEPYPVGAKLPVPIGEAGHCG